MSVTTHGELKAVFLEAGSLDKGCFLVATKFEIDTIRKFVDCFDPAQCNTAFRPPMFQQIPEWERKLGKVRSYVEPWLQRSSGRRAGWALSRRGTQRNLIQYGKRHQGT